MEEDNKENFEKQSQNIEKQDVSNTQEKSSETKFTPLGQISEKKPKRKKKKAWLIIFILLILAIIAGGIYGYFTYFANCQAVYKKIIELGIDKYFDGVDETISTAKTNLKLDLDVDLNEKYKTNDIQEILNIINDIEAKIDVELDTNARKVYVELDSNYEEKELIDVGMLIDSANKETYVKLDQFFNKVIKVDIDEEIYNDLYESLDIEKMTLGQKITANKAKRILKEEFSKIIKEQYCRKETEKITINSKEVNANKYILTMNLKELISEIKSVIENLKNNEEYLNCYENKEEHKQILEEILNDISLEKIDEENIISIKLYRVGLKQDVQRIDFELQNKEEKALLKIEKAQSLYNFEFNINEKNYFNGTVNVEEIEDDAERLAITLKSDDIGIITLNMEYSYGINEEIETLDTRNAVHINDIKGEDMFIALGKLENSKLYELIEKFTEISEENDGKIQIPDFNGNSVSSSDVEKNITYRGEKTENSSFVVFAKNNNKVSVDMEIEVEFYDANRRILGSSSDDLVAVAGGNEIAIEMTNVPSNFATYEIYVDAEKTEEKEYFDKIEVSHNNTGEGIAVQVRNNSNEEIEFITVTVVYYNQGKLVGITDEVDSDIKPGRAGNFKLDYPYDSNYNDIPFDDYKVYVNEAYTYNW